MTIKSHFGIMKLCKMFVLLFVFSARASASILSESHAILNCVARECDSAEVNFMTEKLMRDYKSAHKPNIDEFFRACYHQAILSGHTGLMYNFILRFEQFRQRKALSNAELSDLLFRAAQISRDHMLEEIWQFAKNRNQAFTFTELSKAFIVSLQNFRHGHVDFYIRHGFDLNSALIVDGKSIHPLQFLYSLKGLTKKQKREREHLFWALINRGATP